MILLDKGMKDEALAAYKELITHLNVPYLKFQCTHCGFRPTHLQWQCPQCKRWDTIGFIDAQEAEASTPYPLPQESLPKPNDKMTKGDA